ncbi:hypothetical protein AB5N19_01289 [Seiridium cardinale]
MRSVLLYASTAMLVIAPAGSHVVLETPRPFKPAEYGPTNPVEAGTFPCKAPEGVKLEMDGSPTEMAVGEDQLLTFQGMAVHGGGSCQISLTSDIDDEFQPHKDSRFFVIHSIEGGCPARNVTGNLDGPNSDKYYFKVPSGVDPGKYVLSWSWVPRIGGQPEFYQTCAPIVVSPSKASRKRQSIPERRETSIARREVFPDIFMANMGELTGGCTHAEALKEQIAIAYPNPGKYVERPNPEEKLYPQPCDGNPRAKGGAGTTSGTSVAASTSPISTPLSSIDVSSSLELTSTTTVAPSTLTSMSEVSSGPTPTSTSATTLVPMTGVGDSVCQDGHLLCINGTSFSTCTGGHWTNPQAVAPGTHCTGTDGTGLNIINPSS